MNDAQRRPGVKTSIYLPAGIADEWKASGASITELVREALAARAQPLEATLRAVIREEFPGLPAGADPGRHAPAARSRTTGPAPKRCTHPGTRITGGYCQQCDVVVLPGGELPERG